VSEYDSAPVPVWHGILGDVPYEPYVMSIDDSQDARGWQTVVEWGLEHCLDGVRCTTAQVQENGAERKIGWLPCFNMRYRRGGYILGNRTAGRIGGGYYAFGHDGQWTSENIAEALLKWFGPDLGDGTNWSLAGQTGILEQTVGQWRFEGQTLRSVLNSLIDRRRGQGWTVRVDGDAVCVWVFTHFDTPITVCGRTLPANTEQAVLTLDDETGEIGEAVVVRGLSQRVHKIEVVGERIKSTFSVDYASSTLEAGWSAAEEAAWLAAAGEAEENDRFRGRWQYARVGRYHKIPDAWDWYGRGGGNAAPKAMDDGTVDGSQQAGYWRGTKHFEPYLPFSDDGGDRAEPRFLHLKAFVIPKDRLTYTDGETQPLKTSCIGNWPAIGPTIEPHELAIMTRCAGLCMMYKHLAGADWYPQDGDAYDYETLVVTGTATTDERLRVVVEVAPDEDEGPERTVTIYVPGAEYWWVTPGTVWRVDDDGELEVWQGDNPIRDDSWRLLVTAAMAKAWYARERRAITATWNYLTPGIRVGTMLEGVWNQQVMAPGMSMGTVVSEQVWNFGKRMRTRLKTAFAELDFAEG